MDKPDFSDFYKFKVSSGIIILALALGFPWIYYSSNEILLIPQNSLNSLTEVAIKIINAKQNITEKALFVIPFITILLIGLSIFLLYSGIKEWKKRQKVIDDIQDNELKIQEKSIRNLTEEETSKKIKNEIIDNEGLDPIAEIPDISSKISKYKSIEKSVISIIDNKYNNTFNIQSNMKMGSHEYDLILTPKYFGQKTIVVELKYYAHQIVYANLMQGIRSFLLSIENFMNSSDNIPFNRINFYLIWIYSSDQQKNKLTKYLDLAQSEIKKSKYIIDILIVKDSEIATISLME